MSADVDTLAVEATALASSGYTITAFGRTAQTSYVLVGTRTVDAIVPREAVVDDVDFAEARLVADLGRGYMIVGALFVAGSGERDILER